MSLDAFLLTITAGAAALALWTLARFPSTGPQRVRPALLHLVAALVAAWLAAPLLAVTASAGAPAAGFVVFVLPALTYLFLAGAWLARAAQLPHGDSGDSRAGRGVRP